MLCGRRYPFVFALLIMALAGYVTNVQAKKYMRCELTRELLVKYQYNKTFLSNWVCLIEHESERDTRKVKQLPNGSTNHGLFQINSNVGCRIGRVGGLCNKKCEDFTDDNLDDDVECANLLFNNFGFQNWRGWKMFCNQKPLPNLPVVCNIHKLATFRPARYYLY